MAQIHKRHPDIATLRLNLPNGPIHVEKYCSVSPTNHHEAIEYGLIPLFNRPGVATEN